MSDIGDYCVPPMQSHKFIAYPVAVVAFSESKANP
jgi:hypothetical protein